MNTTLDLDDALIDEARLLTGLDSPRAVVTVALQELIAQRRSRNLLDLAGQIEFTDDFDHKALRVLQHAAD